MTDDTPTVRDRLIAAGLDEYRIGEHLTSGRIHLDGRRVDDLDEPAPPGTRVVLHAP